MKNIKLKSKPLIPITGWTISIALHLALAGVFFIIRPMVIDKHENESAAAVQANKPTETIQKFIDLKVDNSIAAKSALMEAKKISTSFKMGDGALTPTINSPQASTVAIPAKKPGSYSSFCGSVGKADRICYVVDCSGSMMLAFDYVKKQLVDSINGLAPYQYYNVTLFSSGNPLRYPGEKLQRASKNQRINAIDYINNAELTGSKSSIQQGRAFLDAIKNAFDARTDGNMAPELIYIFTDGEFDHQKLKDALLNYYHLHPSGVKINIIACGSKENEPFLKGLASICGGSYTFVTDDQMAKPEVILP
ncbi:MAG: VWA domain-containing protein [Phycisphaerae bacterium]|nr:VWA domain-containing protein [Phycisphaerae bacterium]